MTTAELARSLHAHEVIADRYGSEHPTTRWSRETLATSIALFVEIAIKNAKVNA